jgi:hypothetical protein
VLFADVQPSVDSIVRPTPVGVTTYNAFETAATPAGVRYTVSLPGQETLKPLPNGAVALLAKAGQTDHGLAAQSMGLPANQRVIAIVTAPGVVDARGQEVAADWQVEGAALTLRLKPDAEQAFPITAAVGWLPEGLVPASWWSYGNDTVLRDSTYELRGTGTPSAGCADRDDATIQSDQALESRQLALRPGSCTSLIETGKPYPSELRQWNSNVDETAPARQLVRGSVFASPINRGLYKNNQEDPVAIDVNEVSDTITWAYTSSCVGSARGQAHTHQYAATGWERTGYNDLPLSRVCANATKSTYAKFKGGKYFPACAGGSVTTFYANNIAQALPGGQFRGYVYRKTGGAPCWRLLHWETHRSNQRL